MNKCIRDPESPCEECSICGKFRKRNNGQVYCTNCNNFILTEDDIPDCKYKDMCCLDNCEDSMRFEDRPYYEE